MGLTLQRTNKQNKTIPKKELKLCVKLTRIIFKFYLLDRTPKKVIELQVYGFLGVCDKHYHVIKYSEKKFVGVVETQECVSVKRYNVNTTSYFRGVEGRCVCRKQEYCHPDSFTRWFVKVTETFRALKSFHQN